MRAATLSALILPKLTAPEVTSEGVPRELALLAHPGI